MFFFLDLRFDVEEPFSLQCLSLWRLWSTAGALLVFVVQFPKNMNVISAYLYLFSTDRRAQNTFLAIHFQYCSLEVDCGGTTDRAGLSVLIQ